MHSPVITLANRSPIRPTTVSRLIAAAFLAALITGEQASAQAPVHSDEGRAPSLRPFESDSDVAEYIRHVSALASAELARDNSREEPSCSATLRVSRIIHRAPPNVVVIHATVTTPFGDALGGAAIYFDNSFVGTVSQDLGETTFTMPASRVPPSRWVTLAARKFDFKDARTTATISPGDSVEVEGSLCGPPLHLGETIETAQGIQSSSLSGEVVTARDEGLEEGDIVKLAGRYLIILRRARLFSIDLGDPNAKERALRPVAAISAFGPDLDPHGACFDELVVYGDRIVVVGSNADRDGRKLGLFRLSHDGGLSYEGTYHLRNTDNDIGREHAARIVRGKLVLFEADGPPFNPHRPFALRRWQADSDSNGYRSIARPDHIFRAPTDSLIGTIVALHALVSCDLASPAFACEATVVVGPIARVFYFSSSALYIWARRNIAPQDSSSTNTSESILFRLPLDGTRPRAIRVSGTPIDQQAFSEGDDGYLNVLVRPVDARPGIWHLQNSHGSSAALLHIPLSEFGDGTQSAPRSQYRPLLVEGESDFQSRFVGDWLLYGSGDGWGYSSASSAIVFAVRPGGGEDEVGMTVPHGVDRIVKLGSNAMVVGLLGKDLHFSEIDLSGNPTPAQHYVLSQASRHIDRAEGLAYREADDGSGILGLPVRIEGRSAWDRPDEDSASILFLRNAPQQFSEMGVLRKRGVGAPMTEDDDLRAAICVNLNGDARPFFARGRIFALFGDELVEAKLKGARLVEDRRIDFATARDSSAHR
jgi:hypothetical protein